MSQHPQDLKPRGQKDPLGLIPWSVVPAEHRPYVLGLAARSAGRWPDGGAFRDGPPETWAEHALAELLTPGGTCSIRGVSRVFAHGASKYAPWNWQAFTWDRAAETEYVGAIYRHMLAPEDRDPESGQLHIDHAACGLMIVIWHQRVERDSPSVRARRSLDGAGPCPGEVYRSPILSTERRVISASQDMVIYGLSTVGSPSTPRVESCSVSNWHKSLSIHGYRLTGRT